MANDTTKDDIAALKQSVKALYVRKKNAALALCVRYAARAKQIFKTQQAQNKYWKNQTGNLYGNVFSESWVTNEFVSFFLSLTEDYGKYVILANNRKHDALTPIILGLYNDFIEDMEKIYAD